MSNRGAKRFPPRRLAALSDVQLRWLRPLWVAVLVAAIVLDIAGAVFVLRDAYERDPSFGRFALRSAIDNDGSVLVEPIPGSPAAPPIAIGSRIVAIEGQPIPRETRIWDLAERLAEPPERRPVALIIEEPDGARRVHRIAPDNRLAVEPSGAVAIPIDTRIGMRMFIALTTCLTLMACAILLFLRRPRDPVALLFSFSFLLFAATIDPPLNMWLAAGFGDAFDIYSVIAWVCLVIGIATFPDGKFNPRFVRWILVVAPFAAIPLCIDSFPMIPAATIAFVLPLFLLLSLGIKYRRLEPGIGRQQIKWAAFGFASGLCLLFAAVFLAETASEPIMPLTSLAVIALFNAGFLAMVIGLLVSLIRFRLWEADQVISRSAVVAGVTLGVGVFWTLSMELVKSAVEITLGEENLTVATAVSAVLAAGIFAPTQAVAQRWAKRKFNGDNDRIHNLIARLAVWRTNETPEEIGMRSLSALAAAVHCSSAAIMIDTPHGRSLVASRDLDDPLHLADADPAGDARFVMQVPLEDEDGPIGQLLLGPRSDFNRYNAMQTSGIRQVAEPLAEAFRAAVKRAQHTDGVHRMLGAVEERLSRLEGGGGLSPA